MRFSKKKHAVEKVQKIILFELHVKISKGFERENIYFENFQRAPE